MKSSNLVIHCASLYALPMKSCLLVDADLLSLGRQYIPSSKCTPGRPDSSSVTQEIPTPLSVHSQDRALFLSWSTLNSSDLGKVVHHQNLRAWAPLTVCKKACCTLLSRFHSLSSESVFLLVWTWCCTLSTPPSFFVFSLYRKGSLLSAAWQVFSPPVPFHAPYTCHAVSF